jgi:hypothetical protein
MCSAKGGIESVGDRVVINQDTIRVGLPLTAQSARDGKWTPGSCMAKMGQHHFFDLQTAPLQSWNESSLLPIVPMYYPADSTGTLRAFFFTSPVSQPGSSITHILTGDADWESPALNEGNMCQNWCDDACNWTTPAWGTLHIFLNSEYETLTCPGASNVFPYRSCPATATTTQV